MVVVPSSEDPTGCFWSAISLNCQTQQQCSTAILFSDAVKTTEALSEVLKIPGTRKNVDELQKSDYPCMVPQMHKVSSA